MREICKDKRASKGQWKYFIRQNLTFWMNEEKVYKYETFITHERDKPPSISLKYSNLFIMCLQICKITLKYVKKPHKWPLCGFEAESLNI